MELRTPLSKVRGMGSAKSGTDHWWHQRLTAIANLILIVITLGVFVSLSGTSHADAVALLSSPFVSVVLILTIISVSWHMKLGMQVIIEDYVHHHVAKFAAVIGNNFFCLAVALTGLFSVIKLSLGS